MLNTTPASRRKPSLRNLAPLFVIMPTIALVLSGIITWINMGLGADFITRWMRGFLSALPVMFIAFGFMAVLERAVQRVFSSLHWIARKTILAFCTACMMEFLLSAAVTLSNRGLAEGFLGAWSAAFIKSLPIGLCISLFMGFVVKPRIDRTMAQA